MNTYHVLIAEPAPGHCVVTKLVKDETFNEDGGNPGDFFVLGTFITVTDMGTFDVEASIARSMGEIYTETAD